jgi:hypothetical protein
VSVCVPLGDELVHELAVGAPVGALVDVIGAEPGVAVAAPLGGVGAGYVALKLAIAGAGAAVLARPGPARRARVAKEHPAPSGAL